MGAQSRAVESVWAYPRPSRLEATASELRVMHGGEVIAATHGGGMRVLETSHPPVYYFPPEAVRLDRLRRSEARRTFCEWKGLAEYRSLRMADGRTVEDMAWSYPEPTAAFAELRDFLAFYPGKVDACWVDGERVVAQAGDFYGGWISSWVEGPFKGGPGTGGW